MNKDLFIHLIRIPFVTLLVFVISCHKNDLPPVHDIHYGSGHGLNDEFEKEKIRQFYRSNDLIDYPENGVISDPGPGSKTGDTMPSSVDLNTYLVELPILNQGKWDDCVANTTAQAIYYALKRNNISDDYLPSIKYNWYYARAELCECTSPTTLSGTWIKNLYNAVNDKKAYGFMHGMPTETDYPCGVLTGKCNTQKSGYWNNMDEFKGEKWDYDSLKINYRQIALYATPEQVKERLHEGHPVIFSIMLGPQFYNKDSSLHKHGIIKLPYSWYTPKEGHVMVIVGYDDNGYGKKYGVDTNNIPIGAFKLRNSWGTNWGDGGYWYLPYSFLVDYPPNSPGNPNPGTTPLNDAENYIYIAGIKNNQFH